MLGGGQRARESRMEGRHDQNMIHVYMEMSE